MKKTENLKKMKKKRLAKKSRFKQSSVVFALNCASIVMMLLIITCLTLSVLSYTKIINEQKAQSEAVSQYTEVIRHIDALSDNLKSYIISGDPTYENEYNNEYASGEYFTTRIDSLKANEFFALHEDKINSLVDTYNQFNDLNRQAMDLVSQNKKSDAVALTLSSQYTDVMKNYATVEAELIQATTESFDNQIVVDRINIYIMVGLAILSFALLFAINIFSIVFIGRKVFKPLKVIESQLNDFSQGQLNTPHNLVEDKSNIGTLVTSINDSKKFLNKMVEDISYCLQLIAEGNVNFSIDYQYKGDFIPIKTSMEKIIDDLNSIFNEIQSSVHQISDGSMQMANGAGALSDGATMQASSIEELSAEIEEITQLIERNTKNSQKVNVLSAQVQEKLVNNNNEMQQTLVAMKEIEKTSKEVVKIIKEIDNIAFQTNILSLNAAVEAAKAGDAGRGFAVVADEVRQLASRSAESAKNTASLIKDTITAVTKGSQLATSTANALTEVLELSKETNEIVTVIAKSAEEQDSSINMIKSGVDQIASVVQTNSATAQQSAASSEELSAQSLILKEQVDKFTLKALD